MKAKSAALALAFMVLIPASAASQSREGASRAAAASYLNDVRADIKRSYYDETFHGVDLDAAYDTAKAELARAETHQARMRVIERYVQRLDDSHTGFWGPHRVGLWDYNFGIRFYGEAPFVVRVDENSHAQAAGLRAGDEILRFDGQELTRKNSEHVIPDFLASHPIRVLDLTVRSPAGAVSQLTVMPDTAALYNMKGSDFRKFFSNYVDSAKIASSHVQATIADSIFLWRLPHFAYKDSGLGEVIKRARKHSVLVLDLRGNGGGSIETLTNLVSHFVDREIVVGDLKTRTRTEKFVAKPKKERFGGRMLILTDSETGSAAEIFARLMQLEGKGKVYGDRTAGAVMASVTYTYDYYAALQITISDFILPNGERLEKVGVTPDVLALAPALHIAAGTDALLSYVLLQAGARVSPAAATKLLMPR